MITQQDKQEIIRLKQAGLSSGEIGKRFGICHTTVLYHLKNPDRLVKNRVSKGGTKMFGGTEREKRKAIQKTLEDYSKILGKNYLQYIHESNKVKLIRDNTGNIIQKIIT